MTLKDGVKNKVKKTVLSARWDKLRTWSRLQEDIEAKLKEPEKVDEGITLDIGPQLLHTLRHRSSLRCMNHFSSKLGEIFTAHYNKGAVQRLSVWMLQSKDRDGVCKHIGFETQYEITSMTFIYKHRVYLAFCTDLTLRVFTDSNSNFTEVHCIPCTSTILCLIYNREDDEVYAGGIGFLEEWRIHGAEHAASAVPGKKFITELTRNEWIRDIKVDKKNNQMFALHGNGICVVNYKTRRQVHKLPNRHEGPLKCCCYYAPSDYLITGGADGKIKLFNGTAFNLIHVFLGHHGPVTSIEPHRKDTLLFSCSHDGTVRIWRMDSLQLFMRLDIGEKIFQLSLLGDTEFFFRTDKDVIIYTLNQFYQMFAAVESETHKLLCCRGTDKASRILGSTEDGSVRLFSPVTGLTLTLIYPMPSFQVLSEFAYDIHQDRLHTVLTDGKVLVYNTSANPCRALEIWQPAMEDEEVTNLLIVTVEFLVEDGTDIDNLVFAGLKSGQIILCESVVCILDQPTQAHIGSVTCLEVCTQLAESNLSVKKRSWIILSGGTDSYVKLWNISIDTGERRPVVFLHPLLKVYMAAIPSHICMYSNIISACIKVDTQYGVRWQLLMYKLVSSQVMCSLVLPVQMCHAPDEDHCEELTALDKCPLMNVMLTAGKDGYVKIWSNNNELLREMNFATPIYASCFANDRGDVIVGYGTHICSVSLLDYLPLDNLRQIVSAGFANYKDDARELPVNFDHQAEPWLDLVNLTKYPIEILERRKQKIEEEVIEKLKRASEKDKEACGKFVIFVDGKTTKVIRKEYADRLLNWAKGKQKLKLGRFGQSVADEAEEDTEGDVAVHTVKKRFIGKRVVDTTGQTARDSKEEKEYFDSNKLIEIYPSTVGKAMRLLDSQKHLGPHELRLLKERDLLKRDPIIAPDGYIPNSVIRSKLNIKKIEPPRRVEVKQWRLKPVPKANPDHMPAWWGQDEEVEPTPSGWDDSSMFSMAKESMIYSKSSVDYRPLSSSPESVSPSTSRHKISKLAPGKPITYKMRSRRIDLPMKDSGTPNSVRRRKMSKADKGKKGFKLTSLAVDEDSSEIHIKEAKSGRRSVKSSLNVEILQKLMTETWMPAMEEDFEIEDVLDNLISVLDSNNPMIYESVCTYVQEIFKQLGISEKQLDDCLSKLGTNLNHMNTAIKKFTLRTLQVLGPGKTDVLLLVLSKLTDTEEVVKRAAADAIQVLTGATDKDTLLNVLDGMGITSGVYQSRVDEKVALTSLAERFGEMQEDAVYFDRIQNWVEGTTPGVFEDDFKREEGGVWRDDSRSRKSSFIQGKEASFVSEEKSGAKSSQETARTKQSSRTGTGSTMRRRLHDADGFSTISDSSQPSRLSRRFTPKDASLYKYYDNEVRERDMEVGEAKKGLQPVAERDSDYQSIAGKTSSQILERLSYQDSGIGRDMSEVSHGRGQKSYPYAAPLSPVKSGSEASSPSTSRHDTKDWRKFFELPNAVERRQMEQIKKEMAAGKLKQTSLPPISYFADDLPMLPGEAGTRLLQSVRVGEKVHVPGDGRHRIESVPGKLGMHTRDEQGGMSNFGIIQMQWTTGIPTVRDPAQPPQKIPQHRSNRSRESQHRRRAKLDDELILPNLSTASPTTSYQHTPSYAWELPLPPPPPKDSRTHIPHIKREHDDYCKYYQLVKKKLHLYTSRQKERSVHLPEVMVKRLRENTMGKKPPPPRMSRSPTGYKLGNGFLLPPISLRQVIKTC